MEPYIETERFKEASKEYQRAMHKACEEVKKHREATQLDENAKHTEIMAYEVAIHGRVPA